jgi:hypothetical protein
VEDVSARIVAVFIPAVLLGGLALLRGPAARTEEGTPVDQPALTCQIETAPAGAGEVGLAFLLHNPGNQSVTVEHMVPFLDFALRAFAGDDEVRIVQPMYDTGITPTTLTIEPGETARLPTPIRLRFGPAPESAADDVPTVWTLDRAPGPVRLEATVDLGGVAVGPCVGHLEPAATPGSAGTAAAGTPVAGG